MEEARRILDLAPSDVKVASQAESTTKADKAGEAPKDQKTACERAVGKRRGEAAGMGAKGKKKGTYKATGGRSPRMQPRSPRSLTEFGS